MARDLEKELRQHDGTFPPAWKPAPGAVLVGRLVASAVAPNQFGGETRVVTIEREDGAGRVAVWLGNVGLLALFQREKPRIGDRLGLRFIDVVTTKAGRQCKRFHLIVDRPDADEPDYTPTGHEEADHEEDPDQDPFAEFDEEPPLEAPPAYAREVLQPGGRRRWN